jgi:hypothetical protein
MFGIALKVLGGILAVATGIGTIKSASDDAKQKKESSQYVNFSEKNK